MTNKVFDERHLRFNFDDSWQVEKYDDHPDCAKLQNLLSGTKAVDFIATRTIPTRVLYFIEVKDFRQFPVEQGQELRTGDLLVEVNQKVRDSIAGLVAGHRNPSSRETWQPHAEALHHSQSQLVILLWLEDGSKHPNLNKLTMLRKQLKQKLRWLTNRVEVMSLNHGTRPDGLDVTSLSRMKPAQN